MLFRSAKPIKRTTKLQIELGKRLKKAVCWLQADFPIIDRRSIPQFEIFGIGIYNYFLSFEDLESLPDHLAGEFTVLSLSENLPEANKLPFSSVFPAQFAAWSYV